MNDITVSVDAELNLEELMDDYLYDDDLIDYMKTRGLFYNLKDMVVDYYRGDFDLKGLLKEIGFDKIKEIISE